MKERKIAEGPETVHTNTIIPTSGTTKKINQYKFEDIKLGMEEEFQVTITNKMVEQFCAITGDINPLHNDLEYAKSKGYNECLHLHFYLHCQWYIYQGNIVLFIV